MAGYNLIDLLEMGCSSSLMGIFIVVISMEELQAMVFEGIFRYFVFLKWREL